MVEGATPIPDSSPEVELVRLGAQRRILPEQEARMRALLAGPLDWERLVELAEFHKVVPGLSSRIDALCPEVVPAPVRKYKFERQVTIIAERGQAMRDELSAVTALTDAAGIDVLVFKGPLLAAIYPEAAPRDFADLDLLVRPQDVEAIDRLLRERGYAREPLLDPWRDAAFRRIHFAYLYRRQIEGRAWRFEIDLHWTLLPVGWRSGLPDAELFGRAVPLHGRRHAYVLGAEDTALYLALHGAKEAWKRLRMIGDLAFWVAAHPGLDWAMISSRAESSGSQHVWNLAVLLVRNLFAVELPAPVLARSAADRVAVELAREVETVFREGRRTALSPFGYSRFHLRVLARPIDRLRYLKSALFTPELRHIRMLGLPPRFALLYVPIKVVHDYLALPIWLRLPSRLRRWIQTSILPQAGR